MRDGTSSKAFSDHYGIAVMCTGGRDGGTEEAVPMFGASLVVVFCVVVCCFRTSKF